MIQTLSPIEARSLISGGGLDVVDVRDPGEWSSGHIPQARLVPLSELKTKREASLPHDGILFVCAKGVRSLTAAKLAETFGLTKLYNVAGGVNGWVSAGLPLVQD